ncbi:MAG: 4-hydroxy-tetrahydrodipicolinate synthase [Christensenellales bacterium]
MLFEGSGVALVTPFNEDLSINYDKLKELIHFHLENNTDAIILCGTTGESSTLSIDEFKEIVSFTVKEVNKKIPVIVGSGSNNTSIAVKKSVIAQELGADGLLVVTPYYNKCTDDGLYLHYKEINDNVNIPIILYNVPSRTCVNINMDILIKLSNLKNICALKEACPDLSRVSKELLQLPNDFYIYSGNDDLTLPILSLGGKGVISVIANIYPSQMHNLCKSCFNNNFKEARKIHFNNLNLMNLLFCEVNPVPIKSAMNIMGYNVGKCRFPLGDINVDNYRKLNKILKKDPKK